MEWGPTMSENGTLVIDLDRQRMIALRQMDLEKVKEFLSDDLVWTHTTGRVDSKESQITSMESGEIVYSRYDPSDVKAQDYGDFIVLTGKADIHVNFRGTLYPLDVRFSDGWSKTDGKWKMVFSQATTFTYTGS
jgi:ketosteroid isomerase-like protein